MLKAEKSDRKLVLVFIFGIAIELLAFYLFPKFTWSEGLVHSWYLSRGLIIYKDFASQYFPFLFLLTWKLHQVFGFSKTLTILLSPLTAIVSLSLLFWVSKKWLSGKYRFLPLIFFVFWDILINENHFHTNPFLGAINLTTLIFWLNWFENPRAKTGFLLGFFLSVGFLSQQMLIFFSGIIFLSILLRILQIKVKEGKPVLKLFLPPLLGFLIPTILIFLWLGLKGALPGFYFWNFKWYFIGGYTFTRLGRSPQEVLILLSIVFPTFLVGLLIYFILLKSDFKKSKVLKKFPLAQLFFLLLIGLSFLVSFWYATMHMSRLAMCLPIFAFLFGLAIQLLFENQKHFFNSNLFLIILINLSLFSFFEIMVPKYQDYFTRPRKYNIASEFYKEDPVYSAIEWLKKNTSEEDKLFVLADQLIYFETKRLPSSPRAVSNLPFVYLPISDFKKELRDFPPAYWVVDENQRERFYQFGYPEIAAIFWKILDCEPEVARFGTVVIRRHLPGTKLCI